MRKLLVLSLLAAAAVLGFGSSFAHLASRHHQGWRHHDGRRAHFEARIADVCVEAADRRLERLRHRGRDSL